MRTLMMMSKLTCILLAVVALFGSGVVAQPSSLFLVNQGSFDYIVVGGGTGGCVAAARLAANPRVRVLVIEAGRDNTDDLTQSNGPVMMPGYGLPDIEGPLIIRHSTVEANPGAFTSNHYLPISKTLGGGSTTNGATYSRLGRQDWERFNVSGWSYDEVAPFAKLIETYPYPDPTGLRGTSGKLNLRRFPNGKANTDLINTASRVLGIPVRDTLDSGESVGVSQFYRNFKAGTNLVRESAWTEYLQPMVGVARNLVLVTDATVSSIQFKKAFVFVDGRLKYDYVRPLVAEAVYFTVHGLPSSESRFATVRKEVIVAAGTLNTPKVLMLSGIGPAAHLKAKNVPVLVDSPQVGSNLQDHMSVPPLIWMVANPLGETESAAPLLFSRTGLRKDKFNDFELVFLALQNLGPMHLFACVPVLTRNSANGTVRLTDNNPTTMPRVTFNAFQDPIDAIAANHIANLTRTIAMQTPGFVQEIAPGLAKVPLNAALDDWSVVTANTAAFSGTASYAHFLGTSTMGRSIEVAVVDDKLKVFGTSNVRVGDLSVIPFTTSQSPFATAMLVGERVANFAMKANGDLI